MNFKLIFTLFYFISSSLSFAQKGVRIAYIDFNKIIEEIGDYKEATKNLETKAESWNKEIEIKKMELKSKEDQLNSEKFLLTSELIKDRNEELDIYRDEIFTLQNKYFGINGNYINQKKRLIKPIQDRVLSVVREIAIEKKFDFVFDRSSTLIMLYSQKNYDISELVLKKINNQEKIKNRKEEIERRRLKNKKS
ncbi:MAG: OmpH family outer membrane protein [Flavobacteriaceae bacterium]|tara:strand:+ start:314 stop:895 length:582 start_codon:yes stop_codon:yes gene_type:complete